MPPSDHEQEKVERLRRAMYSRSLSGNLKDRERRPLDQSEQAVGNDFLVSERTVQQTVVAPRGMGVVRTGLWWVLGISIFFFIAAFGYFGYYFLLGGGSVAAAPGNISIAISGPPQVSGGEPTELQIAVVNRNKVPLELADLVINYPAGTRSPTDFATDLPSQRISLGTIEAGGQRQGTISAVFAGNEGSTADVKVELEYRIAGSNAIFVADSNYTALFSSAPLSIAVDGNTQTISGQPIELSASVAANASAPVRDTILKLAFPFGFKLTSAVPAPDNNDGQGATWLLGDITPGQPKAVTIRGALSGAQGDERIFKFAAGTRKDTSKLAIDTQLAQNAYHLSIAKPFLGLAVAVNGSLAQNEVVSPGQNVVVAIQWQNNLSTAINDAVIAARLTGVTIDGTSVHTTDGFFRSTDNTMLWDKTTSNGALSNLPPGAHGTVTFSFQMPSSEALKGIQNPHLDISVNAAGKRVSESGVPENLQSTTQQKIALASDLTVAAQGLYYSNPFGSTGPMPAKAGSETTYAVVFNITNSTNKITNAKLTAVLPPYVRWVGIYSPSTEKLTFNQVEGTLTWDIGDIAPNAGLNGTTPRQAAIAIGFTPSSSQIGQEPVLLQSITLTGTDASTNGTITKSAKDVTTNISGDSGFSAANATVVK